MKDTSKLLIATDFPSVSRRAVDTLQLNLGYLCNLSCTHCHVDAGPHRTELMSAETMAQVFELADKLGIQRFDLTGGSPEMNPHFEALVVRARKQGIAVIDRCNPTILVEPGYESLPRFLAEQGVEIIASMPCFEQVNVDRQRGKGSYDASVQGLLALNSVGYGRPDSDLKLNLVFNPDDAVLPPDQSALETQYREMLGNGPGIKFHALFVLANMPIARFGARLMAKGQFHEYLGLLRNAYQAANHGRVMCRSLLSVDYEGYVYDCDFNQMLNLPAGGQGKLHITGLLESEAVPNKVSVGEHCYGCTAGQGSSCGGALS